MTDTSDVENDNLLHISTRTNRPQSISEQIPSDDDTDTDYDNIYTTGELDQTKKHKSSSSKVQKQKSQYEPLEKHKKHKKTLYIICVIIWCLIIIALVWIFIYYFNIFHIFDDDKNKPIASTTLAPHNTRTTKSPTYIPTMLPTKFPTLYPSSLAPTITPSMHPSFNPSLNPSSNPSLYPSLHPSFTPTHSPSYFPTKYPTEIPTQNPSLSPSQNPSISPTNIPTQIPSLNPSQNPTHNPSISPSQNPSISPSQNPSLSPSQNPSIPPSQNPSISPTKPPTLLPSHNPTISPSQKPSISPIISPTKSPTIIPTKSPSKIPTTSPSVATSDPTKTPTQSPVTMILQSGNEINDQGITMNFPRNAFPDSTLIINIGQANDKTKQIFEHTTIGFKAMSIDNITANAMHFIVENHPLNTSNITYETIIPIPRDLLSKCPADYGYEIFTLIYQKEFGQIIFPMFVLFESLYNPTHHTLTTHLYPHMFTNKTADIILSCTPGTNIVPVRRRILQNPNWQTECKAAEIICPIQNAQCTTLNPFHFMDHSAVDYSATSITNASPLNIIAAANGIIEKSDFSNVYGNFIVIRKEDGSAILYGNLRIRTVRTGQTIQQGQIIGIGGSTHIHFEYIPNGKLYQSKKRINPNDCFPPPPDITPTATVTGTTKRPTQQPLVPPNTHSPTPSPTIYLAKGSITVRDSGALADDSFAVYIDDYKICQTEIGQLNTCAINFIRPGIHTLTLEVLIAPDEFGTFYVELSDGWTFTDGTISKDAINDYETLTPPAGWKDSWNFTVPFPVNHALNADTIP